MKIKTVISLLTIVLFSKFAFAESPSLSQIYFKPYPSDGSPNQPSKCGSNNTARGWINRDLGDGVKIETGIIYEKEKQILVTLLFKHADGKLEYSPEQFKLHVFPNEKIYSPSQIRRKNYEPNSECFEQFGEWVYLTYPVKPEDVEQIALVLPIDAVTKSKRDRIRIRPFRFDKIDESDKITSKPTMTPIKIQGSNPSY
ncbi:MAG: hypothetical protein WC236_00235 [Gallionellaceae bacterium]|jgi:hypothetical protein